MKRWIIRIVLFLILVAPLGLYGLAAAVVGELSRPRPSAVPDRESIGAFPVEAVNFIASDGVALSGWLVPSTESKAVVLLHGLASNRLQHLRKMEIYAAMGFGVLSYDARCHGASECTRITGGLEERLDLEAAVAFMREQGYESIGLDGFSLGAATITFADQEKVDPAFVVLESCYKDMPTLIQNAVSSVGLPTMLATPVLWRMGWKLGESINAISPIAMLDQLSAPTLMLLGDSEFQVSEVQAQEMFDAIPAAQKHIYVFQNADHEVFCVTRSETYQEQLYAFLDQVGLKP